MLQECDAKGHRPRNVQQRQTHRNHIEEHPQQQAAVLFLQFTVLRADRVRLTDGHPPGATPGSGPKATRFLSARLPEPEPPEPPALQRRSQSAYGLLTARNPAPLVYP